MPASKKQMMRHFKLFILASLIMWGSLLTTQQAAAHTASKSSSYSEVNGQTLTLEFTTEARWVTRISGQQNSSFDDLAVVLGRHLQANISLEQLKTPCPLQEMRALGGTAGRVSVTAIYLCPAPIKAAAILTINTFFSELNNHTHYARIAFLDDDRDEIERILNQSGQSIELHLETSDMSVGFLPFIKIGFDHVLGGLDHLAFLLALLLCFRRWQEALLTISLFTIGHSATLALVALEIIAPNEALIEALIGFTIMYAALDGLSRHVRLQAVLIYGMPILITTLPFWMLAFSGQSFPFLAALGLAAFLAVFLALPKNQAQRNLPVLAGLFGLAHGAGFAGAMGEFELETGQILMPLLGFNIGVELGQILFLIIGALAYWLVSQLHRLLSEWLPLAMGALLLSLGSFWFFERALGFSA